MKFGIFYEHQIPRPWAATSEYELFQNSLDQFELADKLGYDYAWVVEHHFLEEYSHSPAPEVFLGAASQRTKRIRLGHGVIQLTTNQPHRVAEKVATLDLLSGGRVELGMGEAAGPAELHPFGVRVRDKRERWEEAVQAIIPMFTEESWEFHGQYYDFPARNVVPKPMQKPHPPLWVACSNIATIASAGEWGMGALGFSFVSPEAAQAWVHRYYNNFLKRPKRLANYQTNPNIAIVNGFMCAETDAEAVEKAAGWTFFIFALSYYGRKGIDAPGKGDLWREYQDWRGTEKAQAALRNGLIGSPETIRKRLRMFEAAHVDQVILLNQAGKTSHADICDSLALFAREVMPEFHARQPEQEAWKQDVLSGRIDLEDLDTAGHDLYSHQNEDIVRLTPEQLKAMMAAKERRPRERMSMRFGVFDHVDRNAETGLGAFYADRLALVEEYDRAGFYGYHVAEHHATPLGMAPSPSVYLSAVAQRTKRLRFGPLVYTLPLYHPIRLLDEICMLDQMSGGRLLLGVGRGISPIELRYWGIDPDAAPAMYAEALELILRGLQTRSLTFEGRYYRFRDYPVELGPWQKPHPPLWYGLGRPEALEWAVRHGVNIVTNLPPAATRAITERYRALWAEAGGAPDALPMMGFGRHLVIAGTDREAYEIAGRGYRRWRESFLHLWLKDSTMLPSPAALFPETFEEAEAQGRAVAGTPDKVRAALRGMIEDGGINYLLCRFAFGDIARDEALQSIRLFTRDVMPAFI